MEKAKEEKKQRFSAWDTTIAFLSLEILALVSFGLGGAFGIRLFDILGFFIGILTFGYAKANFTKPTILKNLKWLIPLGVFFLLLGFSAFFFKYYGGETGFSGAIASLLYLLLETLGLIGFFLLGLGMKAHPQIKKKYILYALLGGLALYCLAVGLYNLIRYGFFYAAIYKGLVYYYQGVLYPVSEEAKALLGFEFQETTIQYALLPAFVLACSGVGLFKMSPKKDKKTFFILLGFACMGLLFMLLIPAWEQLIALVLVYAAFGIYFLLRFLGNKNEKGKRVLNKVYMVLYFVFVGVVAIVAFLLLTEGRLGLIQGTLNATLHRVPQTVSTAFDAVYDCVYNGAENAAIHKFNFVSFLFGMNPTGTSEIRIHPTRFFEINILWQNGALAFLLLCFLLCLFVKKERDYLRNSSKEEYPLRVMVVALLFGTFAYMSFFADESPLIHGSNFMPFTHGNIMLLMAFLMGMSYEIEKPKRVVDPSLAEPIDAVPEAYVTKGDENEKVEAPANE